MIPNAHRMFNFDLGETADAIRDTVHDFSSHEIAPRATEIERNLAGLAAVLQQVADSANGGSHRLASTG